MLINNIIGCSFPIIHAIEPEDNQFLSANYPYWIKGTCFIVNCEGQLFVITAKHVIKNQMKDNPDPQKVLDQVRISYHEKSRNFLPLCRYFNDEEDTHIKDIAIFKVANEMLENEDRYPINSLKLDNLDGLMRCPLSISPNSPLLVRGYPSKTSFIDYDEQKIHTKALVINAKLSGKRGGYLYRLNWASEEIERIEAELKDRFDLNGMSGSPVFSCKDFSLAGVLVWGTRENGHFISARILYKMLKLIMDNAFDQ